MVKFRNGLLITLVLIGASVAPPWSERALAGAAKFGATLNSTRHTGAGPSTEGEPDVGQTGKDTKRPDGATTRYGRNWIQGRQAVWVRLAGAILMARNLGIRL